MKHLERDVENLQHDLLAMAASVEEAVRSACRALRDGNLELAKNVIAHDRVIDAEENRIDEECLKVVALHQPVASVLRGVAAVLKINDDLERMADHAKHIAERAVALALMPNVALPSRLWPMAEVAAAMLHDAIEAYTKLDARLARRTCRRDDEVDDLQNELIRAVEQMMQSGPDHVEPGLSLFSIVRHLERIADHATNIAEDVVYLVEGAIVRHYPSALDDAE